MLHLFGNLAFDAIVGDVDVIHHLKDTLLGLTRDTELIARKDKNLIVRQFLTGFLDFFEHGEIIVRTINVCTADILCRCLGTRFCKEVDGLKHIMSHNEMKIHFLQMFVGLAIADT